MPTRACFLVLPLALACFAVPVSADEWSAENWYRHRSGWEGYGIGTTVHRRITSSTSGPGLPAPMTNVTETRSTLIRVTETTFVVKEETKVGGRWTASETEHARAARTPPQVAELGAEVVLVAGTSYPCRKRRVTWQETGDETYVAVVWENEALGVLKLKTERGGEGIEFTVTKLDVSRNVGGKTVACREMQMTNTGPGGKVTLLSSLEVPGGTVEMVTHMNQAGMQIESRSEVTAFEIK